MNIDTDVDLIIIVGGANSNNSKNIINIDNVAIVAAKHGDAWIIARTMFIEGTFGLEGWVR